MAATDPYAKQKMLKTEENRGNPSKFYTHFFYKALIVSFFLVILPLFPSQAPEFINQNLFTRSWELLHLVFVGIAVSYGIFSHRNDELEKETNNHTTKFDNAQTYVSRFLQVSPVFDDENENLISGPDENKVQTWSSQYYRNEPVVVVAKEHSDLDQEQRVTSSRIGERPLLLPVRSLKSRVLDTDNNGGTIKESKSLSRSSSNSSSGSGSGSGSRRFSSSNSNKRKNGGELGGFDQVKLEDKLNENVVLPSPIPWRSRSGRMEMKEDVDSSVSPMNMNLQSPSNRPSSTSSSPKLSPSPSLSSPKKSSSSPSPSSLSSETQAKNSEDSVRKKSFLRPPPPPPPPPPPRMNIHKSSSMKVGFGSVNDGASFEKKNLKRSFPTETKESTGPSVRTSENKIDQTLSKNEQLNRHHQSVNYRPNSSFMQFPEQDVVDTVDDSETEYEEEDDDVMGETPFISNVDRSSKNEEALNSSSSSVSDGGPDVDKKADEFIAKFREQIRLQRIESIKRSSAQISRNSSRR